ncbi:MAG: Uma2 family endonuclease [Deltaproteobacteria bacterium]|nr:Uma2 family endonuclease [Deltaproteobacteria bacterium]
MVHQLGPELVRPLRRDEYDRLVALGCFADERLELIRGLLVAMSPQGALHAEVIRRLNRILSRALGDRGLVQIQSPLALGDDSEPEPDVAVVPPGDYVDRHPTRALLVIEVADSSLRKDRDVKADLYAAAAIPDYWLIDLEERAVEVFRDPVAGRYSTVTRHGRTEALRPTAFADLEVALAEVLPARR